MVQVVVGGGYTPGPSGPPRKSGAALVGSLLALAGTVMLLVANLSGSWFAPEEEREGVTQNMGLWSYSFEGHGRSKEGPLSDFAKEGGEDNTEGAKIAMWAYGSMAFYVVNWLLIVVLLAGTVLGFARWAAAKPTGFPFALTLIPAIVAAVACAGWLVVSVFMSEALDGMDLGMSMYLWIVGFVCAFVAAILFAKVRSARAFGAGFQGTGAMLPPGAGTVGAQVMGPGQGVIQNPADTLGPPR